MVPAQEQSVHPPTFASAALPWSDSDLSSIKFAGGTALYGGCFALQWREILEGFFFEPELLRLGFGFCALLRHGVFVCLGV